MLESRVRTAAIAVECAAMLVAFGCRANAETATATGQDDAAGTHEGRKDDDARCKQDAADCEHGGPKHDDGGPKHDEAGCKHDAAARITATVADDKVCRTRSDNLLEEIPGTSLTFTQCGKKARPVVVSFVAQWPRPTDSDLPAGSTRSGAFILMEIDGDRVDLTSTNGGVLVHEGTASSVSNGTHGFTFVTDPLPPGDHEVKFFWFDNILEFVPATICVQERSVAIHHP
jgi:hypothetical protein